jgi:hypothetical protein
MRLLDGQGPLEAGADDDLARDAPALAACYEGAVTQRVGLGPSKGRPVMKLGVSLSRHLASARERVERAGHLCARVDGFDLRTRGVRRSRQRTPGRAGALLRQAATR